MVHKYFWLFFRMRASPICFIFSEKLLQRFLSNIQRFYWRIKTRKKTGKNSKNGFFNINISPKLMKFFLHIFFNVEFRKTFLKAKIKKLI